MRALLFVSNVVKKEYQLPFASLPLAFYAKNNALNLWNREFVEKSINELLQSKCIEELSEPAFCTNPLTVAEGKKNRLVLDLCHINQHLSITKFRYENLKVIEEVFEKNYFFSTFGLKSGYHHISIAERCKNTWALL